MYNWKLVLVGLLATALAAARADIAGQDQGAEIALSSGDQQSEALASGSVENSGLWFVELASPPTADGTALSQVRGEKAAFRRAAAQAGITFQERRAFDTLWNGLSIRVAPSQVAKLSRLDNVKAIYPVVTVSLPPTEAAITPELFTALGHTGADIAQTELGFTGAGVKVAVMDTGVDYHNPDLGGCFGPGCRVSTGFDFVGDDFDAGGTTEKALTPKPDNDPDDCNGHGTHVAGIIGGNGIVTTEAGPVSLKGVAPNVTLGAYRVFGCDGSTDADIMVAAMERALADGMQVLNMSIGAANQWPQYPTAQASNRAVNKGMVVVASAGNSGSSGLFSLSAPSVGEKVISVASFDNTQQYLPYFTIAPDNARMGYNDATAAAPTPTTGTFPMKRTGTPLSAADACQALPAGSLTGQVALIRRGTCSFHIKALNAQTAGAAGVVLYNNLAGRITPTVAGPVAITIPVVSVSDTEGVLINNRLAAGPVEMTWTDQSQFYNNTNTPRIASSFTSLGMSPDLTLKPDLGAPGGFIYSAFPLEKGGHASLSGTSMSSPHVAGAVALLLEARPKTPAQAVRGILQNSADPRPFSVALSNFDLVHRQGAGMLDIDDAILSTTNIEPAKLSLGESEAGPGTRTLTITNDSSTDVTYTLSHAPAVSTNVNTFAPGGSFDAAAVAFDLASVPVSSITVPARSSATVNATISISAPANAAARRIYGGYLVFTQQGGATYRVPYAGFRGDYQSITAMPTTTVRAATPTVPALTTPSIAKFDGTTFFEQSAGASFSMVDGDIPFFLVHLDHGVRLLRVEIRDALTGTSWHRALDAGYVGRNASQVGFFAIDWDGTTAASRKQHTVPNGQYVVVVTVLKALGTESNPAHTETWTSPLFQIARPASTTP